MQLLYYFDRLDTKLFYLSLSHHLNKGLLHSNPISGDNRTQPNIQSFLAAVGFLESGRPR